MAAERPARHESDASTFCLANARVVTGDAVIDGGIVVERGEIAEVFEGRGPATAAGLEGDYLPSGLVELHTNNLERQFQPRPKVRWPADAAMLAHDTQVVAAGITTALDAVCVGFDGGMGERREFLHATLEALDHAEAKEALKAEHHQHLRCEISDSQCAERFAPLADHARLKMLSLMVHTPGQRRWQDVDKYRTFHRGRTGASEDNFQALIERRMREHELYARKHRQEIL